MQLEILTFCDAATEYTGRLNIIGATDTLVVPALPFTYPRCAVVARLRLTRIEEGKHTIRVMIIDADGGAKMNVDGKISLSMDTELTRAVNVIVNLNAVKFEEAGEYAVDVAVNGMQLGSTPLFIKEVAPTASSAATAQSQEIHHNE